VHKCFLSIFIFVILYMFRAATGPSSGDTTVFMWHLVKQFRFTLHTRQSSTQNTCIPDCLYCRSICSCIPDSHPYRKTSTKYRINTVVFPDDETIAARNMYRLTNINIVRKKLCTKLAYLQDHLLVYKQENNFKNLQKKNRLVNVKEI